MELAFELRGNVAIIKISGRMDGIKFKKSFIEYAQQTANFVFDLSSFDFLDFDDALGVIVACLKYVSEKDGDIRIGGMSKNIKMMFEITRAYKIFEIFDDVDAAVRSYEN